MADMSGGAVSQPPSGDAENPAPKAAPLDKLQLARVRSAVQLWKDKTFLQSWSEFAQDSTLHGIKHVFAKSQMKVRRLVWILILLAAICGFVIQVGLRTGDFFRYDSNVNVQVIYSNKVRFPAVTICNQNSFRITRSVDWKMYELLDKIYSGGSLNDINFSQYNIDEVTSEDFIMASAHQIDDLMDSCHWLQEPCTVSDFVQTVTDFGICYTFNSGTNKSVLEVNNSGSRSGLSLLLNVEQYEYMKGPQTDAGVKILLHDQDEVPLLDDLGFAVAPGTHTIVGTKQYEIHSLPKPYGNCTDGGEALSACQIDCRVKAMVQQCGCRDLYIPTNLTAELSEVCELADLFTCAKPLANTFQVQQENCSCTVSCDRILYETSLSYTHISKFNAERMVLNNQSRNALLRRKFLRAREYAQRYVTEFAVRDASLMSEIEASSSYLSEFERNILKELDDENSHMRNIGLASVATQDYEIFQTSKLYTKMLDTLEQFGGSQMRFQDVDRRLGEIVDLNGYSTLYMLYLAKGVFLPYQPEEDYVSFTRYWFEQCLTPDFAFPSRSKNATPACHTFIQRDSIGSHNIRDVQHPINCTELVLSKWACAELIIQDFNDTKSDLLNLAKEVNDTAQQMVNGTPASFETLDRIHTCSSLMAINGQELVEILVSVTELAISFFQTDSQTSVETVLEELVSSLGIGEGGKYRDIYWSAWNGETFSSFCGLGLRGDLVLAPRRLLEKELERLAKNLTALNKVTEDINLKISILRKSHTILASHLSNAMKAFRNGSMSKQHMAETFVSDDVKKALSAVMDYKDDVTFLISQFTVKLDEVKDFVKSFYRQAFGLEIPVVTYDEMVNLTVVQHIRSRTPNIAKNITEHCCHQDQIYQMIDQFFDSYKQNWTTIRTECSLRVKSMKDAVDNVVSALETYVDENKMDWRFVMDNFLQVDIFYRELGYEKITQLVAFEGLSLLGEIGGFLGLLLGASVMSVLELVDYLILLCLRKARGRVEANKQ